VAVVSASKRRNDILLALEAGAHGYIPKGLGPVELASAIRAVRSGSIYVPASIADLQEEESKPQDLRLRPAGPQPAADDKPQRLPLRSSSVEPDTDETHLTRRQRDVLELIVQGMSNKEIARALKLGEGTVKVHVAALFRVLGVTSRSAAAAAGMRRLKAGKR
jgi:DNA-binding NarL/FixJ family response regulator